MLPRDNEMFSFSLNNGFRLLEYKHGYRFLDSPFHCLSRNKILPDYCSFFWAAMSDFFLLAPPF